VWQRFQSMVVGFGGTLLFVVCAGQIMLADVSVRGP
jgi:hypothetical protein